MVKDQLCKKMSWSHYLTENLLRMGSKSYKVRMAKKKWLLSIISYRLSHILQKNRKCFPSIKMLHSQRTGRSMPGHSVKLCLRLPDYLRLTSSNAKNSYMKKNLVTTSQDQDVRRVLSCWTQRFPPKRAMVPSPSPLNLEHHP